MSGKNLFNTETSRWEAVVQRNIYADGLFVYAVRSTGIYCRPGCSSRLPVRKNVVFFDFPDQAAAAGFRPCKRCTPQMASKPDTATEAVIKACQIIDQAETMPSLNELANSLGLSPYHFHRLFKKIVGITPKQYAAEKRLNQVRDNLQQEKTVTAAYYNAGYESSSRFYEAAAGSLGMKPTEYQNGGQGVVIQYAIVDSYLGWVLIAGADRGICKIDFGDSPESLWHNLEKSFPQATLRADDPGFTAVVNQVILFLETPEKGLDLPLDVQGTAFQRRVWAALQGITPGSTASYAEIAARIGSPKASRAVAQACAANNLAVAIPCHRVVRSDGELGGYRWGIDRKKALLERESFAAR